jgi:VWFA-related protein
MNNSVSRLLALALALSLCGTGPGFAQDPGGYGAFLDSIEVRLINIDVVVTDKDRRFVPGLRVDDFQLFADGKPVPITHFAAYLAGAPPAAPAELTTTSNGVTAVLEDPEAPEATVAPPAAYAVLIDQTLMRPSERNGMLEQLRRFVGSGVRDGDRVLLAVYDNGLKLLTDLTTDRGVVDAALAELALRAFSPGELASQEQGILRDISRVDPNSRTAQSEAEILFDSIEMLEDRALREARAALDALSYLSDSLAGVEGRKAVLYAGGGFAKSPTERLYTAWRNTLGFVAPSRAGRTFDNRQASEIERRQSALIERAGAHRVTVYPILAGPDRLSGASAEIGNDVGPLNNGSDAMRQADVRRIALATGGLTITAGPQLAAALDRVADDFESYYSLAFSPVGRGGQRLEVKVPPGLEVRYRSQFRPAVPGDRSSQSAVAALLFKEGANPLEAEASAGAAKAEGKGDGLVVPVTVRVPLRHLTLLPEGDHHQARLSFDIAARDDRGRIQVMERRELPLSVPNDKLQAALRQFISFDVQVRLSPGPYRLAVMVEDQFGATRSALTVETRVVSP